jgi:hypothetical protein
MAEVFKSEERVDIAKVAIAPLAAQLGDRGLHVNEVANQFANEKFAQASRKEISSQATLSFVKTTLTQHPELSDEMIKIRTRNMSSQDQQLVSLAAEKSGTTGFKKYDFAEQTIAQIRPLKPEERGDVLDMVKAGESFGTAMKKEKADIAQIAQEDRTAAVKPAQSAASVVSGLDKQALANMQQLADDVAVMSSRVAQESKAYSQQEQKGIGRAMGAVSMTGAAGAMAVGGAVQAVSGGRLKWGSHAMDVADNSVKALTGELQDNITAAKAADKKFMDAAIAFSDAHAKYREAVAEYGVAGAGKWAQAMNAAKSDCDRYAEEHHSSARRAAKADAALSGVYVEAGATVLASGASAGAGMALHGASHGATHSVTESAREIVSDLFKHGAEAQAAAVVLGSGQPKHHDTGEAHTEGEHAAEEAAGFPKAKSVEGHQ